MGTQTGRDVMQPKEKQTVDRLMYRISHDLGASARALVELPQWIAQDLSDAGTDIPEDVSENLQFLSVNAKRLDQMLRDLLEYSRVGRFQSLEKINVAQIVHSVLETCPLPDGFVLDLQVPDETFASAQPDFTRVVSALLTNAIKHHDRPVGHLSLNVDTTPDQLVITMIDDGPGIPPEERHNALDLLRTLRPRDEVEGSGMGLAITEQVAMVNGGSITISDALRGRGCQVCVKLKRGPRLALMETG